MLSEEAGVRVALEIGVGGLLEEFLDAFEGAGHVDAGKE